jgi:hypothetical protein
MERPHPTIEIRGRTATGKSALAWAIRDALINHGVHCVLDGCEEENRGVLDATWRRRLACLKGGTVIVRTVRLDRFDRPLASLADFAELEALRADAARRWDAARRLLEEAAQALSHAEGSLLRAKTEAAAKAAKADPKQEPDDLRTALTHLAVAVETMAAGHGLSIAPPQPPAQG